jgi:hypothetical protein
LGSLAIESPVVSARSAAWIFRNSGDGQPRSRRFVLEQLRVRSEVDLPYPAAGLYAGEGLDIAFEGASISVDVLELAAVVYSDIARKDSSWIGAHGLQIEMPAFGPFWNSLFRFEQMADGGLSSIPSQMQWT